MLETAAPRDKDLIQYSEWRYARFCRAFEKRVTELILQEDPQRAVVLSNDISEGPDFRLLAEKGYPVYTIFHVDVVDYVTRIYLRSKIQPETLARFTWLPSLFGLVVRKQRDSVRYSRGLIVPSASMREVLVRSYPWVDPAKIHVLPWGVWENPVDENAVAARAVQWRQEHAIPEKAFVLVSLSRISPEKGQDRLLKALALWEKRGDFPSEGGVWVFVAGEAAYMQGRRFETKLHKLAARLEKARVVFPGYAAGVSKQALFRLANLYVFPSRHESYGLTMLEAMQAGLPVVATHSYGALEVFKPAFGVILETVEERQVPQKLMEALSRLWKERSGLRAMGKAAQAYAGGKRFSDSAAGLADLLTRVIQ